MWSRPGSARPVGVQVWPHSVSGHASRNLFEPREHIGPTAHRWTKAGEALRRMTDIPFVIGEEFASKWQLHPSIEQDVHRSDRADVCDVGGLTEATKIAGWSEVNCFDLMPDDPLGALCTAAAVHLVAVAPSFARLGYRATSSERQLGFDDPPSSRCGPVSRALVNPFRRGPGSASKSTRRPSCASRSASGSRPIRAAATATSPTGRVRRSGPTTSLACPASGSARSPKSARPSSPAPSSAPTCATSYRGSGRLDPGPGDRWTDFWLKLMPKREDLYGAAGGSEAPPADRPVAERPRPRRSPISYARSSTRNRSRGSRLRRTSATKVKSSSTNSSSGPTSSISARRRSVSTRATSSGS